MLHLGTKGMKITDSVRKANSLRALRHGESKPPTPEWKAWNSMRERCLNPKHKSFPSYGGRGIKICKRWNHYENFLEDMGRRPSSAHSIHRIDNDGDYKPSNCKWATKKEQGSNRRMPAPYEHYNSIKTHCKNGHEFNEKNTRHFIDARGRPARSCRVCHKEYQREWLKSR